MKKIIALVFSIMILVPGVVHAECSEEELKIFKEAAQKIEIQTEHWSETYFYTKVNNLLPDFYVINAHGEKYTTTDASLNSYSGRTVKYFVKNNKCTETLKEINITYPTYNQFNSTKECFLNPEFKYCSKFLTEDTKGLNETEFKKELKQYKEKGTEGIKLDLRYIIPISVILIVIIVTTLIIIKKKKRNKF